MGITYVLPPVPPAILRPVWLLCLLMAFGGSLMAQRVITGRVTGASGEPLIGANVLVKGAAQGTATDFDGNYELEVSPDAQVLIFSYLGYRTEEVAINARTRIDFVMVSDERVLDEIVVTALGIEKEKKSLGYAVQEVDGASLVKAREPNLISSLTGRVAGLTIRNSTDLFQDPGLSLRGRRPLIVIDGVPDQTADFWKVNPDDIAEISVLKGATASALYGAIGRNGAIMITTKRGQEGGVRVDLNSSTMFQPGFIRIPEVQTTYGNGNNGRYAYVNGSGGGTEGGGWIWGPRLDQPDPSTPSGFWETPQYNSPIDPETGRRIPTPFLSRGRDNIRNFFETGLVSTNNISVTGGTDQGGFRITASHLYQKGLVPNTQLNNTSFGVAGNYRFARRLTADASLTYNRQYTENFPEVTYGPQNYLYNLVLWTGVDVDVRDLRNYWAPGQEGIQQNHYNRSWYNNPYFQAYEFLQSYYKDNVFGQINLNYNILPGLSAQLRTGANIFGLARTWKTPKSYVTYDAKSLGDYTLRNENYFDVITDVMLNYSRELSDNFAIGVRAGGANNYRNFRFQSVRTDGLVIPQFYNLSNSINPLRGDNRQELERISSAYAAIDLEFLHAFYLTVTGRNDWVSTLPVENNSFFYPSVSASAVLSEVLPMPGFMPFLKLRGSWSRVSDGRIGSNPYSHIEAYNTGVNWNNNPSLAFGGTRLNPDINPETSDTWEIGLDARFLNNRLGLDVAYYQIRDFNNITTVPVSVTSGFSSRLENGNVFQRRGVEVVLTASPVRHDNFSWDIGVNWSHYRRYLTEIFGGADELNNIRAGERADQLYDWVYAEDPQGNIIHGSNGFPQWDPFRRFIGYDEPDWVYGVQNTFSFLRHFTLAVSVDGRVGGLLYSTTNQKMWWGGTHPGTVNSFRDDANAGKASYIDPGVVVVGGTVEYDSDGNILRDSREYEPNTRAINYISYNINTSNAHWHNYHYYAEDFLKLREVTLTFNLPERWLQNLALSRASVSFVGRNLLLLAEVPNIDPDPGADDLQTPSVRNLGFNINLTF